MDLGTIFKSVTEQLASQQSSLNEADTYNHDHGDHMVQIFSLIQDAVSQKAEQPVANQLKYASQVVEKEADSGSAKLYAQGLSNAAKNFSGTDLQSDTLGLLVKSLLNVEEPQPKGQESNMLGSLLSDLTGNVQEPEPKQDEGNILGSLLSGLTGNLGKPEAKQEESDILGSLLSGFTGSATDDESDNQIGMDDLLKTGMAFYQSKQDGDSTTEALMGALLAASPLGQSSHRALSGATVASTIMNFAKSLQ
jgi:hypothetical protein